MRTGRVLLGLVIFLLLTLAVNGPAWPQSQTPPPIAPKPPAPASKPPPSPKPPPAITSPGTITLDGKLTNAKDEPISNATVTVALWNTLPPVVTDAQGGFRLDELYARLTDSQGQPLPGARVDLLAAAAGKQDTNPRGIFKIRAIAGTVRTAAGNPVARATVAAIPPVIRTANTDKDGDFTIEAIYPGPANITYSAFGYESLTEKSFPLVGGMTLNRTLREKSTGWWLLVLFIPAVFGMLVSWVSDIRQSRSGRKINRFCTAFLYGLVWLVVLWLPLALQGISRYEFLYPSLTFEFYVPLLGFLGALLYVLDLSRKGQEEIDKEAEFQQRIILGPYVAIIMVVVFGKDLGLVNIKSPIGRASIAFFSGFLVVAFLQRIVEKGQEILGEWRDKSASYYAQSEIAKCFNLSKEEDLKLRKAGIRYLSQLDEYSEDKLIDKVKEVGFDAPLAVVLKKELPRHRLHQELVRGFNLSSDDLRKLQQAGIYILGQLHDFSQDDLKGIAAKVKFDATRLLTLKDTVEKRLEKRITVREDEEKQLRDAIGDLVWSRLKDLGVNSIQDFSHLSNNALEAMVKTEPEFDQEDLRKLRDKAKKFGLPLF